jgi:murein DD-endopeptidase MepM/ murein hydrolase activator NlpD
MIAAALSLLISAGALGAEPSLSVAGRRIAQGELLLVVVEGNSTRKPPAAEFGGRSLEFFPAASTGTWLAFLPLDLDASTGTATLSASLFNAAGKPFPATRALDVQDGGFPVTELKVAQKFVTPAKTDAERAEGEAGMLHQLFLHGEPKRLFEGRFDPPIPGASTARFGQRRVFNGQLRAPHSGMDLKAKKGALVRAPASGRVVMAAPLYFSGNTIIIDHGLGVTTLYAHLSRMLVKPDDIVKKGQLIGKVGATGRVTGPHLHWALKQKDARLDPYSLTFLDFDAYLRPAAVDALIKSPECARPDRPTKAPWGRARGGLRARATPAQETYGPGDPITFVVELQNVGKKSLFLDFVRDPRARGAVLGFNRDPVPFSVLTASATSRLTTEQIKIPPHKTLCFAQDNDAGGPVLAAAASSYALTYGTDFLYVSTSTARAGIWRGRVTSPLAAVTISTDAARASP